MRSVQNVPLFYPVVFLGLAAFGHVAHQDKEALGVGATDACHEHLEDDAERGSGALEAHGFSAFYDLIVDVVPLFVFAGEVVTNRLAR